MTEIHDCHNDQCRRNREGIFLPTTRRTEEGAPTIKVEYWGEWQDNNYDEEAIKGEGRKLAQFCYGGIAGNFMDAFHEEYKRLKNGGFLND